MDASIRHDLSILASQKKKRQPEGMRYTLPETNSSPLKIGWLEYYVPIGMAYFQVLLLLVSGKVILDLLPCTLQVFHHQVEKT